MGIATLNPSYGFKLSYVGWVERKRYPSSPVQQSEIPYELVGWYSMLAPAGTPRDIVMTLNRHFVKALEHPSVKASIAAEGALPGGNTPEEFSAFIRSELEKYTKLVKDARLTPDS